MSVRVKLMLAICCSAVLVMVNCQPKNEEEILIATSANMYPAMQGLLEVFSDAHSGGIKIVVGSSGKLCTQIATGAPYDVFVSADMYYPQVLFEKKISLTKPKVYAKGQLVIWTMDSTKTLILDSLKHESIQHIALANPKTAPYGKAAMEVLSFHNIPQEKFIYGEDISQTSQFITSGATDVGFVALSVVLSPSLKNKGFYTLIPDSLYTPIEQGAILLSEKKKANEFYNFLFSDSAQEVLHKFGYLAK